MYSRQPNFKLLGRLALLTKEAGTTLTSDGWIVLLKLPRANSTVLAECPGDILTALRGRASGHVCRPNCAAAVK